MGAAETFKGEWYWWGMDFPIGRLTLHSDGRSLTGVGFPGERPTEGLGDLGREDPGPFAAALRQLGEYFAGARRTFDLPLSPQGTTFQRLVWDELSRIPYGTTISYGELARRIGNPNAVRAVGGANRRNPLPIIIPCHRVIGGDGRLTGFGGGLPIKQALLTFEGTGVWKPVAGLVSSRSVVGS